MSYISAFLGRYQGAKLHAFKRFPDGVEPEEPWFYENNVMFAKHSICNGVGFVTFYQKGTDHVDCQACVARLEGRICMGSGLKVESPEKQKCTECDAVRKPLQSRGGYVFDTHAPSKRKPGKGT